MKNKLSKILGILIGMIITLPFIAYALPPVTYQTNLLPDMNDTRDLGTTTPAKEWNNIYTKNLNISGTCTGCGSGGGGSGTIATSTPLVSGQVDFSTGVNTIGNDSTFTFSSLLKALGFTYGSTTALTISGNTYLSGLTAGQLLSLNALGVISATTTIGNNQLANSSLTVTANSPLTGGGSVSLGGSTSLSIQAASASQNGYLSLGDYSLLHTATTTFSSPLIYTGSTNTVTCQSASGSQAGCLSSTDWNTFNNRSPFEFTPTSYGVSTTTIVNFTNGLMALASSTFVGQTNLAQASTTNVGSTGSAYFASNGGSVGIATSSPFGLFSINPSGLSFGTPQFVVGSSTQTNLVVSNGGNVGVGTSTPGFPFTAQSGSAYIGFFNPSSVIAQLIGSGDFKIRSQGGNIQLDSSGSIVNVVQSLDATAYNSASFTTPGGVGIAKSLLVQNNVGIGTTSPYAKLTIYTTGSTSALSPQMVFSASTTASGANNFLNNWAIGSDLGDGGKFKISSSSVLGTNDRFVINGVGNIGIGSSTPASLFSIGNTNGINFTAATTTFNSTGGIDLRSGGCFSINGTCIGSGGGGSGTVTSITASTPNSTMSLGGTNPVTTSGTISFDLNLGHANNWTVLQQFTNATTSLQDIITQLAIGATATSTFANNGTATTSTSFYTKNLLANTLSVGATGTTTINSSGQVGIASTTPTAMLDINSPGGSTPIMAIGSSSAQQVLITNTTNSFSSYSIGTSTPSAPIAIQSNNVGNLFVLATSSGNQIGGYDSSGHRFSSGPAPSISTCGTGSPSVLGDDNGGTITTGTAATACTLTFAKAFLKSPYCTETDNSATIPGSISTLNTTTMTLALGAGLTGGTIYYQCSYHQ